MISAWWIIPVLMVGAAVGWFAHALVFAGERADEQMKRENER